MRYAASDRPMLGHAIGSAGNDKRVGEAMTCIYGPAVTYAFPDPSNATYRHSVIHVSSISVLDGTAQNVCKQEHLQKSETVLFGKIKDTESIVLNLRGQLQCRMGKSNRARLNHTQSFGNLIPLGSMLERSWMENFKIIRREVSKILERDVLPIALSEIPILRRTTFGMTSPL